MVRSRENSRSETSVFPKYLIFWNPGRLRWRSAVRRIFRPAAADRFIQCDGFIEQAEVQVENDLFALHKTTLRFEYLKLRNQAFFELDLIDALGLLQISQRSRRLLCLSALALERDQ